MDERFDDPSEEEENEELEGDSETTKAAAETEGQHHESGTTSREQASHQRGADTADNEASTEETSETDDEPLNIREDWDSATIYVEPEQSEDIEVTFTRLKKQLKREDITLEKNKHFYRGVFEVAFDEHPEKTKEKIRELAEQDADE
jgi:hypothetical protein